MEYFDEQRPTGEMDYIPIIPAPDVDQYGMCTACGEREELHVDENGEVSVRNFHRSFLGGSAKYIEDCR